LSIFSQLINIATETADTATDTDGKSPFNWMTIVMIVVLVALVYFMMIRPERKKKKERTNMMNNLVVGAEITTIGGIVGKVVHVGDNTVTFETSEDRVRMEVAKWSIGTIGKPTEEAPK